MAKKIELKERGTNETMYPVTTIDCIADFPKATKPSLILVNTGNNLLWLEVNPYNTFAYGVEWDINVGDPHLTRIGNMTYHKTLPIQSQLKGCIAQGGEIIYWLDEDDWTYKKGGNPNKGETELLARLDGYDGTVRVYCPAFYIKSEIDGNKRRVWLSTIKIDDTWTYLPETLIDAYRSTVLNTVPADMGYLSTLPVNSAISVVNTSDYCRGGSNRAANDKYLTGAEGTVIDVFRSDLGKPRTAQSRATMRTECRNAGNSMMSYDQYKNIFYWLYVVEYANFNCLEAYNDELTAEGYHQGGMGNGITMVQHWYKYNLYNPSTPCGYGNNLGNKTGLVPLTLPAFDVNVAAILNLNNVTVVSGTKADGKITITNITSNTSSMAYANCFSIAKTATYKVTGLNGETLRFETGSGASAIKHTEISTDGNVTVEWPNSTANREFRFSEVKSGVNIVIEVVSAEEGIITIATQTHQMPRWRGFDNPFGDVWTNVDGIIIDADNHPNNMNYVYTCLDPTKFADTLTEDYKKVGEEIHQNGDTKLFDLGTTALIIPNIIGGNTTQYKCDYHYIGAKNTVLRTVVFGGYAHVGGSAGLGCFYSDNGVSDFYAYIGFRSAFSSAAK